MRIIAGKYGRRRFDVPTNITARPTTDFARENLFNVLSNLVDFDTLDSALDLFAGTGAVSLELLSRGVGSVTAVEKAAVQARFIQSTAQKLGERNLHLIRGDVFRFLAAPHRPASKDLNRGDSTKGSSAYDLIFADPPYDHPRFAEIPELVLQSGLLRPGGLFIIEHNRDHDFSSLPGYLDHRAYGSVNFTLFRP